MHVSAIETEIGEGTANARATCALRGGHDFDPSGRAASRNKPQVARCRRYYTFAIRLRSKNIEYYRQYSIELMENFRYSSGNHGNDSSHRTIWTNLIKQKGQV
jgi:hypothetical protein